MKRVYDNWEDAARASRSKKAIGFIQIEGKKYDLVKPLRRDGYLTPKNFNKYLRRAKSKEIDTIKRWWPY